MASKTNCKKCKKKTYQTEALFKWDYIKNNWGKINDNSTENEVSTGLQIIFSMYQQFLPEFNGWLIYLLEQIHPMRRVQKIRSLSWTNQN